MIRVPNLLKYAMFSVVFFGFGSSCGPYNEARQHKGERYQSPALSKQKVLAPQGHSFGLLGISKPRRCDRIREGVSAFHQFYLPGVNLVGLSCHEKETHETAEFSLERLGRKLDFSLVAMHSISRDPAGDISGERTDISLLSSLDGKFQPFDPSRHQFRLHRNVNHMGTSLRAWLGGQRSMATLWTCHRQGLKFTKEKCELPAVTRLELSNDSPPRKVTEVGPRWSRFLQNFRRMYLDGKPIKVTEEPVQTHTERIKKHDVTVLTRELRFIVTEGPFRGNTLSVRFEAAGSDQLERFNGSISFLHDGKWVKWSADELPEHLCHPHLQHLGNHFYEIFNQEDLPDEMQPPDDSVEPASIFSAMLESQPGEALPGRNLDGLSFHHEIVESCRKDQHPDFCMKTRQHVFQWYQNLSQFSCQDSLFFKIPLAGVSFAKAKLNGSRFFQTDLSGVDFRDSDLTGVSFTDVTFDEHTKINNVQRDRVRCQACKGPEKVIKELCGEN